MKRILIQVGVFFSFIALLAGLQHIFIDNTYTLNTRSKTFQKDFQQAFQEKISKDVIPHVEEVIPIAASDTVLVLFSTNTEQAGYAALKQGLNERFTLESAKYDTIPKDNFGLKGHVKTNIGNYAILVNRNSEGKYKRIRVELGHNMNGGKPFYMLDMEIPTKPYYLLHVEIPKGHTINFFENPEYLNAKDEIILKKKQ